MNRYVAAGIARDAASGRRVLIVSETLGMARVAIEDVERFAEQAPAGVHRANGGEMLTWPSGGRVSISSVRSQAHRGASVDIVFLDGDAARDGELMRAVSPCIAGSAGGEVIRA